MSIVNFASSSAIHMPGDSGKLSYQFNIEEVSQEEVSLTSKSTTFLFIRHGETEENRLELMQGQQNTELNAEGQQQALELAQKIKEHHPEIKVIYSSDLNRALYTAREVAKELDLDVLIDTAFREISWGKAEGVRMDALSPLFIHKQEMEEADSRQKKWDYPFFENAESYNAVLDRVRKELKFLAQKHPGQTVAIFTHSRVIKILIEEAIDSEKSPKLLNCGIARFVYTPENFEFKELIHLIEAGK
jgi:broad specificity phosphatase PhoE